MNISTIHNKIRAFRSKAISYFLVILLAVHTLAVLVLGSIPPLSRDALIHHLAIPKNYLQHGKIIEIPELTYSYYPMNLDYLYIIPLWLGNDIAPKYIHFAFALMTAGLIFHYLKRRLSVSYGLWGALFFLTIPIIVKLSTTVYVDLGLIFFSTASLLMIFYWLEDTKKWGYLITAAIFCGLGAGTKYNGLLPVLLLTLFIPILFQRSKPEVTHSNSKAIGYAGIFFIITVLCFSPWMIRNYHWTGNPIFPLYNSLFHPQQTTTTNKSGKPVGLANSVKKITSRGNNIFVIRANVYHEPWWQVMLLPARLFFEGKDDDPKYFDGKLTPFLLLFPLFIFLAPKTLYGRQAQLEQRSLLAYAFLLFSFTFFQEVTRIRYITPILPALVIVSTYGLHTLFRSCNPQTQKDKKLLYISAAIILTGLMFFYNGIYLVKQFKKYTPVEYLSGKINRTDYIAHHLPEYTMIDYMNKKLPENSSILAVFLGSRSYYFDHKVSFDFQNGKSFLCETTRKSKTILQIAEAVQRRNITHLLIRYDLFSDWTRQNLSQQQLDLLSGFFRNHTRLVTEEKGYGVFEIM